MNTKDGLLLIDKPQGMTSHDVVQFARRRLAVDKIGHTGTLDPNAAGLMILTVGKATKILPYLSYQTKEYIATLKLGVRTDTGDIWGTVIGQSPVRPVTEAAVRQLFADSLGPQTQIPPMYSAKKVQGRKLVDLARRNITVERAAQPIVIDQLELLALRGDSLDFRVVCSGGTYIRVLCEDLAAKLGQTGTMAALRRIRIGPYPLADAYPLEELPEDPRLISIYDALNGWPMIEAEDPAAVFNGRPLKLDSRAPVVMVTHDHQVLAVYQQEAGGLYRCRRGLW